MIASRLNIEAVDLDSDSKSSDTFKIVTSELTTIYVCVR